MARYIDADKLTESIKYYYEHTGDQSTTAEHCAYGVALKEIDRTPTADVAEVKDCNLCVYNHRHATEYPCSHCKNCYKDKFKPIEECTPQKEG